MPISPKPDSLDNRLRPEPGAIQWNRLNESQREAFRRVLYMMDEAIAAVPDYQSHGPGSMADLVQKDRSSRTAFVSGARGAGKTSVMLSLIRLTTGNEDIPYAGVRGKFGDAIKKSRQRVVWLEPIDLDPLPSPFSLLPSILDRVWQAIQRLAQTKDMGGSTANSNLAQHELFLEFQDVYREATLAWESNILDRKQHLDSECYAQEMQKTNRARLSLSQRIDRLLGELSRQILDPRSVANPIYVVTIDDFDMHPTASLDILKMLRMLTSPRLFFLMLGDINILEVMSDLGTSAEIGRVLGRETKIKTLGIPPGQIAKLGGAISRNALRKLLPTGQRVYLDNPSIVEGLLYHPDTGQGKQGTKCDTLSLVELCLNIPFLINPELLTDSWSLCGCPIITIADYLFHPGFYAIRFTETPRGDRLGKTGLDPQTEQAKSNKTHKSSKAQSKPKLPSLKRYSPEIDPNKTDKTNHSRLLSYFKQMQELSDSHQFLRINRPNSLSLEIDLSKENTPKHETARRALIRELDAVIAEDFSWANHLFVTSPRRLADFWFSLRRQVISVKRDLLKPAKTSYTQWRDILSRFETSFQEELARMCRDALLEETAFTPEARERISAALTPSSIGDFNWSELPVNLVAITEAPIVLSGSGWAANRKRVVAKGRVRNVYHEIRACRVAEWTVVAKPASETPQTYSTASANVDASRELSPSTSALVMLLHDNLKLSSSTNRFETNLIPNDDGTLDTKMRFLNGNIPEERAKQDSLFWCNWASTQYRGSYHNVRDLYWPPPSAMSITGIDLFRRSWNRTLADIGKLHRKPTDKVPATRFPIPSNKDRAEAMAYGWIAAGCAVIDARELEPISWLPDFTDWQKLFHRLNFIASHYFKSVKKRETENTTCMKNWLQNVVALVMPEMGLPAHLMFQLLFGLNVPNVEQELLDSPTAFRKVLNEEGLTTQEQSNFRKRKNVAYYRGNLNRYHHYLDAIGKAVIETCDSYKTQNAEKVQAYLFSDGGEKPPNAANEDAEACMIITGETKCTDSYNWFRAFPFIEFMRQNKTEIRARRGVHLSLLMYIAEGEVTRRLRRNNATFLADSNKHSELKSELSAEFGLLPRTVMNDADTFTTGKIFGGGGLVPHEDDIPNWQATTDPVDFSRLSAQPRPKKAAKKKKDRKA